MITEERIREIINEEIKKFKTLNEENKPPSKDKKGKDLKNIT